MKRKVIFFFVLLSVIFFNEFAFSQTTVNPDISFIGDFRMIDYNKAPEEIGPNQAQLMLHELEIAAGSYLNPYSRADLTLGLSEEEIDIEEAYAILLRGLPWNLQVRAGQYLVDFGKLNTQHAHQWPWIERPLMFQRFFGEEGFKDAGVNVTTLMPLGSTALNISGSILQGGFLLPEEETDINPKLGGNLRISTFAPISDHSDLEIGFSGLIGQSDIIHDRWAKMLDMDFKYKWKPSIYRSLIVVAEGLVNFRKVGYDEDDLSVEKDVSSYGGFAAFDYQFHRQFDVGAFIDYSQSPIDENDHLTGYGVFAGFALVEETYRIGVLLRQDEGIGLSEAYQTIQIQLLWSLGPHKPHQF